MNTRGVLSFTVACHPTRERELQNTMKNINGIRAKGRKEYLKYKNGGRLTHRQAILARCYDCMGNYIDGRMDCQIPECPLYPFMPYREEVVK